MESFRKLPLATQIGSFILLGFVGMVIWDQYHWWQMKDEYAFGYIVPLFVAFIVYDRWAAISAVLVEGKGSSANSKSLKGLRILLGTTASLMLIGGFLCFLLGSFYRAMEGNNLITSNFLAFGFGNILLGGVYLYSDKDAEGRSIALKDRMEVTLLFLFPALIWMLSVPMFSSVHNSVSTFLMNKVAIVVHYSFDVLGFAIIREGSVLKLPNGDVGVEDACSGIRSLTACLFAGSFLGASYFNQLWKKVLLVGTAMFFAFVNNILRSLFLTSWAYAHGPEGLSDHVIIWGQDLGNIHDFTGWVVLGITVLCLFLLVKLFSIQLEYEIPKEETEAKQ